MVISQICIILVAVCIFFPHVFYCCFSLLMEVQVRSQQLQTLNGSEQHFERTKIFIIGSI